MRAVSLCDRTSAFLAPWDLKLTSVAPGDLNSRPPATGDAPHARPWWCLGSACKGRLSPLQYESSIMVHMPMAPHGRTQGTPAAQGDPSGTPRPRGWRGGGETPACGARVMPPCGARGGAANGMVRHGVMVKHGTNKRQTGTHIIE
jgi:hypothetical protein